MNHNTDHPHNGPPATEPVGSQVERGVVRLEPERAEKPRIRRLMNGGWLCEGGNLGGTGWKPAGAYRVWLWNMVHNGSEEKLREFGVLPP